MDFLLTVVGIVGIVGIAYHLGRDKNQEREEESEPRLRMWIVDFYRERLLIRATDFETEYTPLKEGGYRFRLKFYIGDEEVYRTNESPDSISCVPCVLFKRVCKEEGQGEDREATVQETKAGRKALETQPLFTETGFLEVGE